MKRNSSPSKGIPERQEIISDRAELVIFALLAVVLAVILYLG
jgi:type VI protein secretion system component VasF